MATKDNFRKRYDKWLINHSKTDEEYKQDDKKLIKILNDSRYRKLKVNENESFGAKVADAVAKFGGSWKFINSFIIFLVIWVCINVFHVLGMDFDPYPFILLNLALSMIAAIQAPIIMMSQNRQSDKDKAAAENDAKVNKQSNAKINLVIRRMEHLHHEQEETQELNKLVIDLLLDRKEGD